MKVADKFIVFNKPDIGEEEMSAVMDVMRSGWVGTGNVARQFEEEFARFMGGGYAVSVSSCTMGLQLALKASGVKRRDEVITTPLTFAATVNAIISVGAFPVFVDVDKSGCLDPDRIKINDKVKAVVPIHLTGTPCNMGKIKSKSGDLKIIEDCAHSFGGNTGSIGDFQVFSFYANKNITCGEGGMVFTQDKEAADRIRILSMQGLSHGSWSRYSSGPLKDYQVEEVGYKGNMPDILAAIGLVQLRRWPEIQQKRMNVWRIYEQSFGSMPRGHSSHLFPIFVKRRDDFRKRLYSKGIGTGIHYKPLHLEPAYKSLGYSYFSFPMAEKWGKEEVSLPVSSTMTEEDAWRVVEEVKKTKGEMGI